MYAAGTRTLTPAETRALVGDSIPAQYYDGSAMVDFTFSYGGTVTLGNPFVDGSPSLTFSAGDSVIWYSAQVSPNLNPQYITVDVRPRYSFFDTEIIQQMCGLTTDVIPGVSAYSPPSWRWHTSYSGDLIIENQMTANSAYYAICDVPINNANRHFTFIDCSFSQQSDFSAYSDRALFYGNSAVSGWMYFIVSCPTISDTSTMASGTDIGSGSGAGGGDVNVSVTVDMEETNSILTTISGLLSGLVDGIKNLFIPTQQDITDFKTGLDTLLSDIFGPLWTAQSLLRTALLELGEIQLADSVLFPGVTIDVSGNQTFTLASQSVPLNPDPTNTTWSSFLEAVRLAIDIVCTVMVINMLKDKLEYIINHPRSKP